METRLIAHASGLLVLALAVAPSAPDPERFSAWTAPVSLGPVVNSSAADSGAFISKDGLTLYFGSNRPGGVGNFDIWVSRRVRLDGPWGPPQNLGPAINTPGNEQTPALSPDGRTLYFASDRPEGLGGMDLYRAGRPDVRDDLKWDAPENLGSAVNTSADESGPTVLGDEATAVLTLCFNSSRAGGLGLEDIYVSTAAADGKFGAAALDRVLSGPSRDVRPAFALAGLELYFDSNRKGSLSDSQDIWMSSRASLRDAWSPPVRLPDIVNGANVDARPAVSFEGTELYFHSIRPGGLGATDLYVSTRSRIK
jgi:hypothetical protein